ncbi:MAG: hypothetical protein AAGD92_04170 [Pseudomonadota bacterium]
MIPEPYHSDYPVRTKALPIVTQAASKETIPKQSAYAISIFEEQILRAARLFCTLSAHRRIVRPWNCCKAPIKPNLALPAKQTLKLLRRVVDAPSFGDDILLRYSVKLCNKRFILSLLASPAACDCARDEINVFVRRRIGPATEDLCKPGRLIEAGDWRYLECVLKAVRNPGRHKHKLMMSKA